jgi:hypothetical protein
MIMNCVINAVVVFVVVVHFRHRDVAFFLLQDWQPSTVSSELRCTPDRVSIHSYYWSSGLIQINHMYHLIPVGGGRRRRSRRRRGK